MNGHVVALLGLEPVHVGADGLPLGEMAVCGVASASCVADPPLGSADPFYNGTVSFALHGAGLLATPMASGPFMTWGRHGRGHWITVYANSGHAWGVVAGRAFDTANYGGPNTPAGTGPRWRTNPTGNLNDGTGAYIVRHPAGL